MTTNASATEQTRELAGFSDRIVAFGADAALFIGGYFLSFSLAFPEDPIVFYPGTDLWGPLWVALFVVYLAYFTAEGRVTLGERLAGVRVVDDEESPLSLMQSLIRTAVYPLSALSGVGLLWALADGQRRSAHDIVAGSLVVRSRPSTGLSLGLMRAGAAACFLVVGMSAMWVSDWGPRYRNVMAQAYAQVGFKEIAGLENRLHSETGHYTDKLTDLAPLSGDSAGFLADMDNLYDFKEGFEIDTAQDGFTINAYARDQWRTPVTYKGS